MRIISGKHKGRRLTAPKNLPVRPTTDQAKEGLFNILWNLYDFEDLSILDLFSGTGNIAFEFLSRGSTDITAVDQNFGCLKFIKKTSDELDGNINTIKSDVFAYLKKTATKHDLIFADPPYNFSDDQFEELAQLVFERRFLNDNGLLIIEHSKRTNLSEMKNFSEARHYGNSAFSFFRGPI